ncbi:hypothetical protein VCHA53O466_40260 [Vibrio chagasii]|nr:hypothetical protein VCHA53O466_40260 [Vibrio chagasii]
MLKIKLGRGQDVMKYPRKALPQILNTYSLGNSNKFFSCHFESQKKVLLKDLGQTDFDHVKIISIETKLYALNYSEFYKNTRTVQMLNSIERSIRINLDIPALGYVLFFDKAHKTILVTFYFVNKQIKTDSEYKSINKSLTKQLEELVDARAEPFGSVFRSKDMLLKSLNAGAVEQVEYMPEPSGEVAKAIYNLSMTTVDPVIVQGIHRACRGMDMKRAEQFLSSINDLITLNGDPSIKHVELPKSMKKKRKGHSKVVTTDEPSLTDGESFSEAFEI